MLGSHPCVWYVEAVEVSAHILTYVDTSQITGWIDEGLNEKAYIVPGLGDFGERRQYPFNVYFVHAKLTMRTGIACEWCSYPGNELDTTVLQL